MILRLRKDIADIKKMRFVRIEFPKWTLQPEEEEDEPEGNPKEPKLVKKYDITYFNIYVQVQDGLYRNKWFKFRFHIPDDWPNVPPDVKIVDQIWHPNIELVKEGDSDTGRVCVSTLKNNYRGTMLLSEIVDSLKFLLNHPNPNDALNVEAADEQKKNYEAFKQRANNYMDDMEEYEDLFEKLDKEAK